MIPAPRVARVLVRPGAVFAELRDKPVWLGAWAAIAAVVVLSGLVTLPYSDRLIELQNQQRGDPAWLASATQVERINVLVVAPFSVLVLAVTSALVMWIVLRLAHGEVRFRALQCAAVFSQATAAVQAVLQTLALLLLGSPAEAIRNLQGVRVSLGADLLVPAETAISPFLRTVLAGVGPLQIWGLIITAVGVRVLEGPGKKLSWFAALTSYGVLLVVGAALSGVGGGG